VATELVDLLDHDVRLRERIIDAAGVVRALETNIVTEVGMDDIFPGERGLQARDDR